MTDRFHDQAIPELPKVGTVVSSGNQGVGVGISAAIDARSIKAVAPYGIHAKPPIGAEVLLLPIADGSYLRLDVSPDDDALSSGEILLQASSGAYIRLAKDGTVIINGQVFPASS